MELPDDVLQIIKEYSRPLTRPDWRTLHKMTQNDLYHELFNWSIYYEDDDCWMIKFKHMYLLFENDIFHVM